MNLMNETFHQVAPKCFLVKANYGLGRVNNPLEKGSLRISAQERTHFRMQLISDKLTFFVQPCLTIQSQKISINYINLFVLISLGEKLSNSSQ